MRFMRWSEARRISSSVRPRGHTTTSAIAKSDFSWLANSSQDNKWQAGWESPISHSQGAAASNLSIYLSDISKASHDSNPTRRATAHVITSRCV